jgi:hypothetical protein
MQKKFYFFLNKRGEILENSQLLFKFLSESNRKTQNQVNSFCVLKNKIIEFA